MNKRDEAILSWLEEKRKDMVEVFERVFKEPEVPANKLIYFAMSVAFEAGRTFQHKNSLLELNNPSVY